MFIQSDAFTVQVCETTLPSRRPRRHRHPHPRIHRHSHTRHPHDRSQPGQCMHLFCQLYGLIRSNTTTQREGNSIHDRVAVGDGVRRCLHSIVPGSGRPRRPPPLRCLLFQSRRYANRVAWLIFAYRKMASWRSNGATHNTSLHTATTTELV